MPLHHPRLAITNRPPATPPSLDGHCSAARGHLERGLLDVRELREVPLQVRIALLLDLALVRTLARGGALSVARVELVDNVHARLDRAERREALAIEELVVAKVDENLRGPRVGSARREGEGPALV